MKNDLPLVSVIVPVYNVEKYIDVCIESIINQTYKNIEILLIDDGSTDDSGKKCDLWKNKDKRINVIHKKNSGLGLTRNVGILKSTGKYITFVDSDDELRPEMIEKLVYGINLYHSDACVGGYSRINEKSKTLYSKEYGQIYFENKNDVKNSFIPKLIGGLPNKHDSIKMSVWNVLFSTKIIKQNKLLFISERKILSEDIIWDINYFINCNKVQLIKSTDYLYRIRSGSLTDQIKYDPNNLKKVKDLYLYEEKLIRKYKIDGDSNLRLKKLFFINLRGCLIQDTVALSGNKRIDNIQKIFNDGLVTKIINEYPVNELEFKQKIFIYLIKNKKARTLIFLLKHM